jgi:hypothetical protein
MSNLITDDDASELFNADIDRVDLVGKAANGTEFLLMKSADESGNLLTSSEVRELIKEAETMTITAPDVAPVTKDDLDAGEVLVDVAGTDATVNNPGSAAWEKVDSATAAKWAQIAARLKNALELLSDREDMESVNGDGESGEDAWCLDDAADSLDFAIGVLASYSATEATEAEMVDEMNGIQKAFELPGIETLAIFEALAPQRAKVMKSGRVLSSQNETLLRTASDGILKVLAALPAAPEVADVVKTEDVDVPRETSEETDVIKGTDAEQATLAPVIADAVETDVEDLIPPGDVAKADAVDADALATMSPMYNLVGKLIGVVDPVNVIPLSDDTEPEAPAAEAPAAVAPVAAPPELPVAKSDEDKKDVQPLTKSDIEALIGEALAKAAADNAEVVKVLKDEIEMLSSPAKPRAMLNGQQSTPQSHLLRGQDMGQTADTVDPEALRKEMDNARTPEERDATARRMQKLATDQVTALRAQRPTPPMPFHGPVG